MKILSALSERPLWVAVVAGLFGVFVISLAATYLLAGRTGKGPARDSVEAARPSQNGGAPGPQRVPFSRGAGGSPQPLPARPTIAILLASGTLLATTLGNALLWKRLRDLKRALGEQDEQLAGGVAVLSKQTEQRLCALDERSRQTQAQVADLESRLIGTGEQLAIIQTRLQAVEADRDERWASSPERTPSEPFASGNGRVPLQPGTPAVGVAAAVSPIHEGRAMTDPSVGADPDIAWLHAFSSALQSHRHAATSLPEEDLRRWVQIAARVEDEGRASTLVTAFGDFMALARERLGIDLVKPQLGASVIQPSIQVERGGPLDGVVAEVVTMGLRTRDGVLRRALVKSRPTG